MERGQGNSAGTSFLQSDFFREYGMVFVLLLLVAVISLLTIDDYHPNGAGAGRSVAETILQQHDAAPRVLIVTGPTDEDHAFAEAAREELQAGGAVVLGSVSGQATDAKRKIAELLAAGNTIDAIAANNVASQWPVYDAFDEVGRGKCVTPTPYPWPKFLKISNLLGVANQTAIYAIIAIGMTMVIITGGIDLSVGSLMALASICMAVWVRGLGGGKEASLPMLIAGCAFGIGICASSGAFVGVMVTKFRIPSFIVTLSIMLVARGLALRLAKGQSINDLPPSFKWLAGETLGIPNPVLLMIAFYFVAHLVMSRTTFGRHIYAIGGNERAAYLSGIRVKRVLLAVYTICGALAGLGGIVFSSKLGAADPTLGQMDELVVIAAVVVGGTSLMGGQGRVLGTLIGAFIITVITNGMNMMNIAPFDQLIALGAVLLAAVLLDTLKRRGLRT